MKILMLTPYLPYPPQSGGQVRSYNLIKNLAKRHQITLFSLISQDEEEKYVGALEEFCQKVRVFKRPPRPWTLGNILQAGFGFYPLLVIRNFSGEEKEAIRQELENEEFDLIHAENFYVMPHIPKTDIPILLTEQTIFYQVYRHFVESLPWYLIWLKPFLMIDVWKLKYWETFYLKKANYLAAVSEEDYSHVKRLTSRRRIDIIPNGVDFRHFSKRAYKRNARPTVLFGAADFHWMQNKEGAEILISKVWPLIKERVVDARLWIVGKIAPEALSRYHGQKDLSIQEIDDSRKAYQQAWVLIAPMRSGGGSRTKFFEAMASGLPIVTTPEGIEGIAAESGKEVIVEDDLSRLAEKAAELLLDAKKAEQIGLTGKVLAQERYDWGASAEKLDQLYEEIGHAKKN